MRYYDRTFLLRRGIVIEEPRRHCPECHCDITDDENRHAPDCRFFPFDEGGGCSEDDVSVICQTFQNGNPAASAGI